MSDVSYTPAPYEQAYYEGLFQTADVRKANSLGGAEAVAFLSRSKLPLDVLKNIWTLSDQNPTSNSLDRKKFATAVRLIQLSQNGQKAQQGANLAAVATPPGVNLRPVIFEGVSGVSIPMPQQQAPPPPQQQMRQAPPLLQTQHPPRPPMQQAGIMSMALTTQDPYSLPPQDQARYEGLFAQYAKEDGFVYGQEAVALFSKSGLSANHLRDIWNMVDHPVDNRLDKLEFAIAMHLIVCVSKNNMPMPQGLTISLKALKSQQQQQQPQTMTSTSTFPQQMGAGSLFGGTPQMGSTTSVGSGPSVPQLPLQMMGASMSVGSGGPPQIHSTPPAEIHVPPPPLQPTGGMNIDAFEGLDGPGRPAMMGLGTGMSAARPGPSQLLRAILEPVSVASAYSFEQPQVETVPEPTLAPAPMKRETPKSSKERASKYDLGDNAMELNKLKTQLQKLQAENNSLRASLGSMTEEEKEVQREIGATVAEIGKLSIEQTALRAQVLAAKSALLEATVDLKGRKDKKAMITDLIRETQATKDAINTALDGVHEVEQLNEVTLVQASMSPLSYEADLFSWGSPAPPVQSEPEPAHNFVPEPAPMAVFEVRTASTDEDDVADGIAHDDAPAAFDPALASYRQGFIVNSSYDEDGVMGGSSQKSPPPFSGDSPAMARKMFGGDDAAPAVLSSPTAVDVDSLKESARFAEQTAAEAEEKRRGLAQQADELRKIADQAEEEVRAHEATLSKKKGGFGRKRKEAREIEKAKQEAAEKQKQFVALQKKASDAQALALETRREVDRLAQQAEQAEIEAVQAVSMQQSQTAQFQIPVQYAAPSSSSSSSPHNGGHEKQSSFGGFGGGFGIMGGAAPGDTGGEWHIPSPPRSTNGDAHPFG